MCQGIFQIYLHLCCFLTVFFYSFLGLIWSLGFNLLLIQDPHFGFSLGLFNLTLILLSCCSKPLAFITLDAYITIIAYHQSTPNLHKETHPHQYRLWATWPFFRFTRKEIRFTILSLAPVGYILFQWINIKVGLSPSLRELILLQKGSLIKYIT